MTCVSTWMVDHPRIRGEHGHRRGLAGRLVGSSPHTRGARTHWDYDAEAIGIIPAYAGSTAATASLDDPRRDHPRIRGEHLDHRHPPGAGAGSSPHTRGAQRYAQSTYSLDRIIPAYAGSTPRPGAGQSPAADHPRIRGEHSVPDAPPRALPGSSPHTRGAQDATNVFFGGRRIIPAYAGSTCRRPALCRCHPDHPRIRGEHGNYGAEYVGTEGSSPHTRGALLPPAHDPHLRGIIPAYAGSTG